MNRRSRHNPEAIAFARDQRARANEFANDVWRMVAKEPSGSGVIWIVVVGLVVVAIPSAWFWYVRTR